MKECNWAWIETISKSLLWCFWPGHGSFYLSTLYEYAIWKDIDWNYFIQILSEARPNEIEFDWTYLKICSDWIIHKPSDLNLSKAWRFKLLKAFGYSVTLLRLLFVYFRHIIIDRRLVFSAFNVKVVAIVMSDAIKYPSVQWATTH